MISWSHSPNSIKSWMTNDGVIWWGIIDNDEIYCLNMLTRIGSKFNIPSDDTLSPVKPERDEVIGSIFSSIRFILFKLDLNKMLVKLTLSTKIRYTLCPAKRNVTTMVSVCGCHIAHALSFVKMMGSLERCGILSMCSVKLTWWENSSVLACWA